MSKLPLAFAFLAVIGLGFVESCDFKDKPCPMPFTKKMQKQIVNMHNELRRTARPPAKDMQKMYWDKTMAKMAQDHALKCVFQHNPSADRRFSGYAYIGQNLYASSNKPSVTAPVKSWYDEIKWFTFGKETKKVVGHYTQVMRGPAARIGCAGAYCPQNKLKFMVFCNYLKGQFDYKTPYTKGKTCGACPKTCKNKLCDCGGKVCQHGGILDLNTCKCKCKGLTKGKECQTFICNKEESKGFCKRYTNYCDLKYGFQIINTCPKTCGRCK